MAIQPLTTDELFTHRPAILHDWEMGEYALQGHLDAADIDRIIWGLNDQRGITDPVALIPDAVHHAWAQFAHHTPDCWLNNPEPEDQDGDASCDCQASGEDGHLHTVHTAPNAAGALPVTWIRTYCPDSEFLPEYAADADAAKAYVAKLRDGGWFDRVTG